MTLKEENKLRGTPQETYMEIHFIRLKSVCLRSVMDRHVGTGEDIIECHAGEVFSYVDGYWPLDMGI